ETPVRLPYRRPSLGARRPDVSGDTDLLEPPKRISGFCRAPEPSRQIRFPHYPSQRIEKFGQCHCPARILHAVAHIDPWTSAPRLLRLRRERLKDLRSRFFEIAHHGELDRHLTGRDCR